MKAMIVEEIRNPAASGGEATVGFNLRVLNTVRRNEIGGVLANNRVTLPAGKYLISAATPFLRSGTSFCCISKNGAGASIPDANRIVGPTLISSDVENIVISTECYAEGIFSEAAEFTLSLFTHFSSITSMQARRHSQLGASSVVGSRMMIIQLI